MNKRGEGLEEVQSRVESIRSQMNKFYVNKKMLQEQLNLINEMNRAHKVEKLEIELRQKYRSPQSSIERLLRQEKRTSGTHQHTFDKEWKAALGPQALVNPAEA